MLSQCTHFSLYREAEEMQLVNNVNTNFCTSKRLNIFCFLSFVWAKMVYCNHSVPYSRHFQHRCQDSMSEHKRKAQQLHFRIESFWRYCSVFTSLHWCSMLSYNFYCKYHFLCNTQQHSHIYTGIVRPLDTHLTNLEITEFSTD